MSKQLKTPSKKRKYKPKKGKRKDGKLDKELRKDLRQWAIFSTIYIIFIMVLSGTAKVHFPDPIFLGFIFYLDVATGIFYGGIAIWSIISILIFKRVL